MNQNPPQDSAKILETLTEMFDELSPQLQRAARFVIDQPREVGVHSMRALATRAEVHPNTLVRLAQAIGFDGFEAMRERFRDFVVAGGLGGFEERAHWLRQLSMRGGTAEIIGRMAASTADNLETMWRRQDMKTLETVADLLIGSDRVFVLGMGSAYSLAHHFWYVARMGLDHVVPVPRHGSHPIDDLATVGKGDLLIAMTFQPYRCETLEAAAFSREAGATVVGISDSLISPLGRHCHHLLVSPTHTPHFFESHAAVMALLEGLTATAIARAGEDADRRIGRFHRQRHQAGLYSETSPAAKLGQA